MILTVRRSGPRVVTRSERIQSPQVGALVVLGKVSRALTTTALASTLGIFAFIRAVLSTSAVGLYGPLRAKHRCSYVVGGLLTNKPEVPACALFSMPGETGMPKVIGLHQPQV